MVSGICPVTEEIVTTNPVVWGDDSFLLLNDAILNARSNIEALDAVETFFATPRDILTVDTARAVVSFNEFRADKCD